MHCFHEWSALNLTTFFFSFFCRWSVRHMLTEFLMVAILVYLQLTDHYAGVWSMCAAIISLVGPWSFTSVIFPKKLYDLCMMWKHTIISSMLFNAQKLHLLTNEYRCLNSIFLLLKRSRMESEFWSSSNSDNHSNGCGCVHNMELYKRISRFWISIKSHMPTSYYSTQHAVIVSSVPHVIEELLVDKYEANGCSGRDCGPRGQ